MKFKILCFILLLSISKSYCQNLFEGFKFFKIPRSNVPLGAEWINGVGVNGDGVEKNNIRESGSVDYLNVSNDIKNSVSLSVLSFLGLSADYENKVTIHFGKMSIFTIEDITKTNMRSGQNILYEYLVSDSIHLEYNRAIKAKIETAIKSKVGSYNVNAGHENMNRANFSGEGLVFAYRVFKLGDTQIKETTKRITDKRDDGGIRRLKVANYDVSFDDEGVRVCNKGVYLSTDQYKSCRNYNPIRMYIKDFTDIDINGQPFTEFYQFTEGREQEYQLTKRSTNKIITDVVSISYHYKLDSMEYLMSAKSKISIKRLTIPLITLKNPYAPGW